MKRETNLRGCTPGPHYQDALQRSFPTLPVGLSPRAGLHDQAVLRRDATGTIYRAALRGCATNSRYEEQQELATFQPPEEQNSTAAQPGKAFPVDCIQAITQHQMQETTPRRWTPASNSAHASR